MTSSGDWDRNLVFAIRVFACRLNKFCGKSQNRQKGKPCCAMPQLAIDATNRVLSPACD